jgi:hypothetical protein
MSEYQYYEFLAIDRPLERSEITALRALSSRAEITPTTFTNVYNWGGFKGSPAKLMEKYFDAHIYVANWGTRHLMLRLPRGAVDEDALASYVIDDVLDFWTTDEHLIIQWLRNEEPDDDWVEGKAWMARFLPLREELRQGDYRALYLGWLYGASVGNVTEDETEPPVPAGLRSPTAAQHALAEFLGIDEDLFAAAALTSPPAPAHADSERDMMQWLTRVPVDEAKRYLLLLLQSKARQAEQQIQHAYAMSLRSALSTQTVPAQESRSLAKLRGLAEQARTERREREEKKRERELAKRRKERERYLATLAEDFEQYWKKVYDLAEQRTASAYDRARDLLVDLSEAASLTQRRDEFVKALSRFRATYARLSALLRRLDTATLSLSPEGELTASTSRDPERN